MAAVTGVDAGVSPDGTRTGPSTSPGRGRLITGRAMLVVLVIVTGCTLLLGYANKARCTGPQYDAAGRSEPDYQDRINLDVCYSDIQFLWLGRDIDKHVFPYVNGSIEVPTDPEAGPPALKGGTVEYPVLSGLLIWAGAIFADNDGEYLLYSALLMAPFGLATGWMLGRLARWRALVWALGPPVVLYAFHNWDLPVVACAVGAVFAMHAWRTKLSLVHRATIASVLLGLGFAFKLYPGAFVLPLALYVLTMSRPGRLDWAGAIRIAFAALATVVLVNLPFAVAGYDGWRASFTFQQLRKVDITTNSIWYWGHQLIFGRAAETTQTWHDAVAIASPALIFGGFALALWLGLRRWTPTSAYPWVGVSAAMLAAFMLFHKVHSPQYTLWIIPFLVLLEVPWSLVAAYLVADAAVGVGVFRYFAALGEGEGVELMEGIVQFGVWLRTALLITLFFLFLRARVRGPRVEPSTAPGRRLQPA